MLQKKTVDKGTLELLKNLMQDELFSSFNLVGGTALALQIGHRKSVDLDLFTEQDFDFLSLMHYLQDNYSFVTRQYANNTLIGTIKTPTGEVKVDFIKTKGHHTLPIIIEEGIRLLDFRDIAAMKLLAISSDGTRMKDFIDIAFLSKHESLKEMLDTFSKFYGIDDTIHVIKSLTFFDDITNLESIDLIGSKLNWELIKTRLIQMAHMPNRRFKSYPV
jgi:hypothetical protein